MEIKLKHPAPAPEGEGILEKVFLRRIKGKDLKFMPKDGDNAAAMLPLIAALTDLPLNVIEEMDMDDLNTIGDEIGKKYGLSQETGTN